MLNYKAALLALKYQKHTYFKITDIFTIKAVALFPKPICTYTGLNVSSQSNISHLYGYNWGNLLLLTAFHAY